MDGGPTKNKFLMQFQADMLRSRISISDIEEASALGAVVMNGLARKVWPDFEAVAALRKSKGEVSPDMAPEEVARLYAGWRRAVKLLTDND